MEVGGGGGERFSTVSDPSSREFIVELLHITSEYQSSLLLGSHLVSVNLCRQYPFKTVWFQKAAASHTDLFATWRQWPVIH